MEDINKNLTQEQKAAIKAQDVTKGVVDVDILETTVPDVPEQPVVASVPTVSVAEQYAKTRANEKAKAEQARIEADKIASQQSEQEMLVNALGQATLGRADAETQAIADAGINSSQAEIDALDEAILSASTALKQQEVNDAQAVANLAGQGRGVPAQVVRGKQALLESQLRAERNIKAIELENDIATSELLQGKVDSAKKAIERSIELQFADKERELLLEQDYLSRIDTKEAQKRSEALTREQNEIASQKEEADEVFNIAAQAAQAGAGQAEISAINSAKNRNGAIAAAKTLGKNARLERSFKQRQLDKINIEIDNLENPVGVAELTDKQIAANLKPLSGEAAKTLASSDSVSSSISYIQEKIRSSQETGVSLKIMAKTDPTLARYITMGTDSLGRLKSGGAINNDEDKRFNKLINSSWDSLAEAEEVASSLDVISSFSNGIANGMDPSGDYRRVMFGLDASDYLINTNDTENMTPEQQTEVRTSGFNSIKL